MIQQIALISETPSVSFAALAFAAAAIQKQITRDVGPLWGIQATVDCFDRLQSMPSGYWPIIVRENLPPSSGNGIHEDRSGQPFALIRAMPGWELSASHEAIEMLIDPSGKRTVPGQSLLAGQGRVDFLVEVCDPCQAFSYDVNGIRVSDFCTPNYFDPLPSPAARYSFTNAITAPRQVLKNGYLSWHDPISNNWFRASFFGPKPRIIDMGPATPGLNFRSFIYRNTPEAFAVRHGKSRSRRTAVARENVMMAAQARAASLQKQIAEILSPSGADKRSVKRRSSRKGTD